ncbi:MAG: FAD-dependent oxidoreductase [Candidatus Hydrogenedentes bacterium]|nr:FAD-dependent oxidoreductase [Candidatus Hydrogenedentota bacterium]
MELQRNHQPFATVAPAINAQGGHHRVSFWHETVDIRPGAALQGEQRAQVAIVGGGFTGLSIAYYLKRYAPELDVVLLEQGVVGHGASGRNGGFAMPLVGWDLLYVVQKLGDAQAHMAYSMMYRAVAHVKTLAQRHAIDCDLETTGYLMINTCAAREARARQEYEAAQRLGFDHAWLDARALQEHIRSEGFLSGIYDPHPCILNPAKFARGMKTVVESMGVRVYEQTPVERLHDGKPIAITTPEGVVRAEQVVMAVNGYGESLGFKKNRVLPVHTYIVMTEPLSGRELEEIGWGAKRTSLETARHFIHYFRLTADNRILFGGEDAQIYAGGALLDSDAGIQESLKERFREYFPALKHVKFTHGWGGVLGVGLDMFPAYGTGGDHGTIYHACAYAGHGVSLSNYAGAIMAPPILDKAGIALPGDAIDEAKPFFYNREPQWLPGDPLRYWGMQAYRGALRLHDWWQGA